MIQTYVSTDKFIFKYAGLSIAMLPFTTLELQILTQATPANPEELKFAAGYYKPGMVVKDVDKEDVVLGPPQDYRYELILHGVGNPDYGQFADIAPRERIRFNYIADGRVLFLQFQEYHNMGMGNIGKEHGVVWNAALESNGRRKRAGRYHYNGNFDPQARVKAKGLACSGKGWT